ncbi:hypothetical protein WJX81_006867 [Elliptochloris bilobata]|uniref:Response regulatory domain-containing protein n=1 Tax=Elliptochloris bilobata TaxID=381761 RepID=A0AAW1SAF3_9CHLO
MALAGRALDEADTLSPSNLRILVVDASASALCALLQECGYEVTAVPTTTAALHLLKRQQARSGSPQYDLILKDHDLPASNACRLLRRLVEDETLKTVPVVVVSNSEDRDVMASCLQLGAADFLLKPLRANELRNLWARVYWWRRAFYLQQQASAALGATADHLPGLKLHYYPNILQEDTKGGEDASKAAGAAEDERSGEGSAPNGSGSGNLGGCKRVNGSSRCQVAGGDDSATKPGGAQCQGSNQPQGDSGRNNGDSATKAGGRGNGHSGLDASMSGQEGGAGPASDAPTVIRPQPIHGDVAGFRAYISPAREAGQGLAGLKRKAPDGGSSLPEQLATRGGSLASGRTGSDALPADPREGTAAYGSTAAAGSLPTAASEDTRMPNGGPPSSSSAGGANGGPVDVNPSPNPSSFPTGQAPGRWASGGAPTGLHHPQAALPAGMMPGPYGGPPPFFPQYGMPPPGAYSMPGAMPGAFWPGVGGGRGGSAAGQQGTGKPDKFDNMSVAYYSAYSPQQMAAAAAAAGSPSARNMEVAAAQQQQQLALMYQQSLLLQQYREVGGGLGQLGGPGRAHGAAEEDEEDDVVNSPQEARAAATTPAPAKHAGSASGHATGAARPASAAHASGDGSGGRTSPMHAAAGAANGALRARATRTGNGSSDFGSNSPDIAQVSPDALDAARTAPAVPA